MVSIHDAGALSPVDRSASSTPDPVADRLEGNILDTLSTLKKQTDMSPRNPVVNRTLGAFVPAMTKSYGEKTEARVLQRPSIVQARKALLEKLNQAECEMEKHWANTFVAEPKLDSEKLKDFWYHENYVELTDYEVKHWKEIGDEPRPGDHVTFVGSGSLPLTAIMLQEKTGAHVTCVDCDPKATELSRTMIDKLGMSKDVDVVQATGEDASYEGVTHAVIAALVPNQVGVLEKVMEQSPNARVAVRSADGLRTLLYAQSNMEGIEKLGFEPTGQSETNDTVVNTLVTFRPANSGPLHPETLMGAPSAAPSLVAPQPQRPGTPFPRRAA